MSKTYRNNPDSREGNAKKRPRTHRHSGEMAPDYDRRMDKKYRNSAIDNQAYSKTKRK